MSVKISRYRRNSALNYSIRVVDLTRDAQSSILKALYVQVQQYPNLLVGRCCTDMQRLFAAKKRAQASLLVRKCFGLQPVFSNHLESLATKLELYGQITVKWWPVQGQRFFHQSYLNCRGCYGYVSLNPVWATCWNSHTSSCTGKHLWRAMAVLKAPDRS